MSPNPFHRSKVRLGRISYMNVAPVYHGIDTQGVPPWAEVRGAPPSALNRMLADGDLDISPVSSAAYARRHREWLLLPDLSISCAGEVMSVLLVSRRPFDALTGERVLLTSDSAAAAALLRLLFMARGVDPVLETGRVPGPGELAGRADAALVIGDAALKEKWGDTFPWIWDLGRMWWDLTGLPFVFAVWAVRRSFARRHPERVRAAAELLRRSKAAGLRRLDRIARTAADALELPTETCGAYFRRLGYDLGRREIDGLSRFFSGLHRGGWIPEPVPVNFVAEGVGADAVGAAA